MWPFSRKPQEPKADPYEDYIDCSRFMKDERIQSLTIEERDEVVRALSQFQDHRYHPDIGDSLLSAVAAAALCNYASRLIEQTLDGYLDEGESRTELSDKAIVATRKAIDLYPHPVLFSRLANFLERTGWANDANTIREIQSKQDAVWVEKRTDELLMIRLDSAVRMEDE
jgi:hypothetical protein